MEKEKLEKLHEAVADALQKLVVAGNTKAIDIAVRFLKDNGFNRDLTKAEVEGTMPKLDLKRLPTFEDELDAAGA